MDIFHKGLVHDLSQNFAVSSFFFFFLGNIGVEKGFCTVVDRKQVTLDYKNIYF